MVATKSAETTASLPVVGIATAVIAIIITAAVAIASIVDFQGRIERIGRTNMVISRITELSALMSEVQTATRGFVITGNERFVQPFDDADGLLPVRLKTLEQLIADDPQQKRSLVQLNAALQHSLAFNRELLRLRRSSKDGAAAAALVATEEGERTMKSVRDQAAQMVLIEQQLLATRSADADTGIHRAKSLIMLGSVLGIGTSTGAFLLLLNENRRRRNAEFAVIKANATLAQYANSLEATNQELESFSYSISHDLRIPLRAVSGYAYMLEEDYGDKVDDEGKRFLAVIRDNSRRMGALIDDLLAFSRFGRQSIQAVMVDMHALVEHAIEQVQRKEDTTNAQITIGDLPQAYGDRALLQQVWLNLISNALKYSSTRSHPDITISGIVVVDEVRYTVKDNGVGFDMQYYNKLFGVFQRLHTDEAFHGTGVGLAIAHRIVTRHGGRIWGNSVLDHGATFSFSLPLSGAVHE